MKLNEIILSNSVYRVHKKNQVIREIVLFSNTRE